jgi:hypothetical protein
MICCQISTTEDYLSQGPHGTFALENQKATTQSQISRIHSIIESACALLGEDEDFLAIIVKIDFQGGCRK